MNSPSREELLSAYLDDELSADQRAQVETWLVEDAAYRQLLEELRAVRTSMQSLPRHKLGHGLADAVLRRAERAMLAGEAPSAATTRMARLSPLRQWWSKRNWRMIVWPAVAAAAALLIALFDVGQQPAERQVAQKAPREVGELVAAKRSADGAEPAPQLAAQVRDERAPAEVGLRPVSGGRELEGLSRPIAAPAPAQVSPSAGATMRRMNKQALAPADSKSEVLAAPALVVCDVAAAFIDQRVFEVLLDEKKLVWEHARVDEKQSDPQAPAETDKSQSVGQRYVVQATPEELAAVVSDLSARKSLVLKVESRRKEAESVKLHNFALRSNASDEARAASTARQPITFWLRPVAAKDGPRDDGR